MYTHQKQIIKAGQSVENAKKAIILIHGRGASAESIISIANHLELKDAAIYAPQATNYSWYPYSFMAPESSNQPALNSTLDLIKDLVDEIKSEGFSNEQLYFLGFSQGACVVLEFTARNAQKYGGIIAFTGGLIGEKINLNNYSGDFSSTPILITTSNPDPHVPLLRVEESIKILQSMGANVKSQVYDGKPHTIILEEIKLANELLTAID